MAHPNEELIRAGLKAFGSGDVESMRQFFAPDVVWHVPGRSQFSGDYKGQDETLGLFARLFEFTGGTFRLDVHDVLANDEHGVVLSIATAERGGKRLSSKSVQILHIQGGKATESWLHPEDQYASDDFFG